MKRCFVLVGFFAIAIMLVGCVNATTSTSTTNTTQVDTIVINKPLYYEKNLSDIGECINSCDLLESYKNFIKNTPVKIDLNDIFPQNILINLPNEYYSISELILLEELDIVLTSDDENLINDPDLSHLDTYLEHLSNQGDVIDLELKRSLTSVFALNDWVSITNAHKAKLFVNEDGISFETIRHSERIEDGKGGSIPEVTHQMIYKYYIDENQEAIIEINYFYDSESSSTSKYYKRVGNNKVIFSTNDINNTETEILETTHYYEFEYLNDSSDFNFLYISEGNLNRTYYHITGNDQNAVSILEDNNQLKINYYEDGIKRFSVDSVGTFMTNITNLTGWSNIDFNITSNIVDGESIHEYRLNQLVLTDDSIYNNDNVTITITQTEENQYLITLSKPFSHTTQNIVEPSDLEIDEFLSLKLKYLDKDAVSQFINQVYNNSVIFNEPFFSPYPYETNYDYVLNSIKMSNNWTTKAQIIDYFNQISDLCLSEKPTILFDFDFNHLTINDFSIGEVLTYNISYEFNLLSGPFDRDGNYLGDTEYRFPPFMNNQGENIPYSEVKIRILLDDDGKPLQTEDNLWNINGKIVGVDEAGFLLIDDEGYPLDEHGNRIVLTPSFYVIPEGEYSLILYSDGMIMEPIVLGTLNYTGTGPFIIQASGSINNLNDYYETYGEGQFKLGIVYNYDTINQSFEGIGINSYNLQMSNNNIVRVIANGKSAMYSNDGTGTIVKFEKLNLN